MPLNFNDLVIMSDGSLKTLNELGGSSVPYNPENATSDMTQVVGVNSDGKLFTSPSGSTYSTDEVKTGNKWIDGSDIYSKTFTGTVTGNWYNGLSYTNKNHGITTSKVVKIECVAIADGNVAAFGDCVSPLQYQVGAGIHPSSGLFCSAKGSSSSSSVKFIVTVYYTK